MWKTLTHENLFLLPLLAVAIMFLSLSSEYSKQAGLLPAIVSAVMTGLVAVQLAYSSISGRQRRDNGVAVADRAVRVLPVWFILTGTLAFYLLLTWLLGYPLATTISSFVLARLLQIGRLHALLLAVASALFMCLVFSLLLKVPLPSGVLMWG